MELVFLGSGTSHGVPVIACNCAVCSSEDERDKRLRSSVWLHSKGVNLIIDTGPDFRAQMLRHKLRKIDGVLITHGHKDHIGGLDDLRPYNYLMGKPVDVYASHQVQEDIRRDFYYAFAEVKHYGIPEFKLHTIIDYQPFFVRGIDVLPLKAMHNKLAVFGFRIGKLAYITDANYLPEESLKNMYDLDVLVINALRNKPHVSHFSLNEALQIIDKVKPKRAYLTHISHKLGTHAAVQEQLPENVFLAYDNLSVRIENQKLSKNSEQDLSSNFS